MLFSSPEFIFLFLPVVTLVTWALARQSDLAAKIFLILASVVFYTISGFLDVIVLAVSLAANFALAMAIERGRHAKLYLVVGIVFDVAILGYFKYFDFLTDTVNTAFGREVSHGEFRHLPLAISFFTFQQIAFLIDVHRGRIRRPNLGNYVFFLFFFPHLIAGPITSYLPISRQVDLKRVFTPRVRNICFGLALFSVGLAKKVLIADPLGIYVKPFFADQEALGFWTAWLSAFGYSFQIYFDFSGYTDMALGIALLFGVVLPQNFDIPYRSLSIQDFWRRWHMTLSRFLRDYLYIPLGGSRSGLPTQVWALFATMALGGLWHGAGLTFVAWGVAHGLALIVALFWRRAGWPMPAPLGWLLTFLFVVLCWVLFRAPSFEAALAIYKGLFGLAPIGTGFKWRALLPAAAFAIIGPTAWNLVHRLPPARWLAMLAGLLFVLILLKIGEDANYEFIYFQF